MRVGSECSGIGGIDLGLERAGMTVIWQSETDSYCSQVLKKHWPNVPNLGDLTTVDWASVERPDLVCAGYPCQPFSYAGRRSGEDDPRHLWPHVFRSVRILRPEWVLLENVPGHLSLGFGAVLADLASVGYDCEWECIPAAAVGAPHLRWRIFVVAHTDSDSEPRLSVSSGLEGRFVLSERAGERAAGQSRLADTDQVGRGGRSGVFGKGRGRQPSHSGGAVASSDADRQPLGRTPIPWDERGHWEFEPDVGRVANGIPRRVDRLRGLGNAVVPQVAEYVGRLIMEAHNAV